MKTMSFNHDGCDGISVVTAMLLALPVRKHGIKFDREGDSYRAVDRVEEYVWKVSFRPVGEDPSRTQRYTNPIDAARAIVTARHAADSDGEPDSSRIRRFRSAAKAAGYRMHYDGDAYSLHGAQDDYYGLTLEGVKGVLLGVLGADV
jgi:hypothetical protein